MKLKYTTKLFVVVNLIVVAFRTVQIMLLTESGTAFLKPNMLVVNIIGTVLVLLSLGALCFNANGAVRQPEALNCKGVPSAVVASLSGALYLAGGCVGSFSGAKVNVGLRHCCFWCIGWSSLFVLIFSIPKRRCVYAQFMRPLQFVSCCFSR